MARPGVIIVSNRLPMSVKKVDGELEFYPSVGGIATGLSNYITDKNSMWIGWPGIASDDLTEDEKIIITDQLRAKHCYPVFLSRKQLDDFYNGYSNRVLWPLMHDLKIGVSEEEQEHYYKAYRTVNRIFAETTEALVPPGSTIWVHDYQLMLLPALLSNLCPDGDIGFFLHITFPSPKVFSKLTRAKALIEGLLGAELVGFHTKAYVSNFLDNCQNLNIGIVEPKKVLLGNRVVRVTDFPMGIDYAKFAYAIKQDAVKKELRKLKALYRGKKVILTVDRLDPTKGLVERLKAYKLFLTDNPKLRRKVIMVMLAVPSRTDIVEYKRLKKRVDALVAEINNQFGTSSWQPVDYKYTSLPFEQLSALYQRADVAFIVPLRDGMNLVAKEYMASHVRKSGVLILSETTGAAEELKEAIIVNPSQSLAVATALKEALTLPRRELKRRAQAMQRHIASFTVHKWASTFVNALADTPSGLDQVSAPKAFSKAERENLLQAYRNATKRLLLLDYDGTLAPFVDNPEEAAPLAQLKQLLIKLTASTKNDVVIVSGRSKDKIAQWFDAIPLGLAVEHGALYRPAGSTNWQQIKDVSKSWKKIIRPILEDYANKTPGAFVEEKEWSIVWHYRQASPYYAHKNLVILRRLFRSLPKSSGLILQNGNMILEVRPRAINKGLMVKHCLTPEHDFVLILGDDLTDEDMFVAAPPKAFTIKVGRGRTHAAYRLSSITAANDLLEKLI